MDAGDVVEDATRDAFLEGTASVRARAFLLKTLTR